jgi:hypothetical protein
VRDARGYTPTEVAVFLRHEPCHVPASIATVDAMRPVEQLGSTVDLSLVTLPATGCWLSTPGVRNSGGARVAVLSWAQGLGAATTGIVISYTLYPLVAWLKRSRSRAQTVIVMASVIGALVLGGYSLRGHLQKGLKGDEVRHRARPCNRPDRQYKKMQDGDLWKGDDPAAVAL